MNKKIYKVIKEIVNSNYPCKECEERQYCMFQQGSNTAFDCCECTADEFSEGVYATLSYLASVPMDKASDIIADTVKEDGQA